MTVRALLFSMCLLGPLGTSSAIALAQDDHQTPQTVAQPRTPTQPSNPSQPGNPDQPRLLTPPGTPAAEQPARRERPQGQAVNIKVDVTITDQRAGAPAIKKTVTVVTADGLSGYIRTQASYTSFGEVPLNIDTEPFLLPDGKIRLHVNLQYDLPNGSPTTLETALAGTLRRTAIRENLAIILDSGKPLVVAQSADPVVDRQVTIEVKATVLR